MDDDPSSLKSSSALGTTLSGTGLTLQHLGWEAGKNWVENTRAVKIPSSTVRAGHCSAPLLSDRHTEVGKDTLQIQKWRVESKACNCRFFPTETFPCL